MTTEQRFRAVQRLSTSSGNNLQWSIQERRWYGWTELCTEYTEGRAQNMINELNAERVIWPQEAT